MLWPADAQKGVNKASLCAINLLNCLMNVYNLTSDLFRVRKKVCWLAYVCKTVSKRRRKMFVLNYCRSWRRGGRPAHPSCGGWWGIDMMGLTNTVLILCFGENLVWSDHRNTKDLRKSFMSPHGFRFQHLSNLLTRFSRFASCISFTLWWLFVL